MQTEKLQVLFELKRYAELIKLCRENPSYTEDPEAAWYCTASFIHTRQFKDAVTEAKQGITLYPESCAFFLLLATAYIDLGLGKKAENACQRALACGPEVAQCHLVAAHVSIAMDRYAKALDHLQQVLEAEPDHSDAHLLLANVYFFTDQEKLARESVTKALEIAPDNAAALAFLADLSQKRVDKTSLLKKALFIEPSDTDFQKRYREETRDRYRTMFFASLFAAGLIAYSYFSPPAIQESGLPISRFLILSVFLYISRYYFFTFFLSLAVALSVSFLDGELFQTGFALKNFSELAAYVIVAFLAVLLACILRTFLIIPLLWLQDKWKLYMQQREADQQTISLHTSIQSPLTWYYFTGAFVIPLTNCVSYYISTQVFWIVVLASFLLIATALFFLAQIHIITVVIKASLLYGFCLIVLTIFCGAMVDGRNFLVIPVVFFAALAGTTLAHKYGVNKKETIIIEQKSRESHIAS